MVAASPPDVDAERRVAFVANPYAPPGVPGRPPTVEERIRNLSWALVCTSVMLIAAVVLLAVVGWLLHVASTT